MTCVTTFSTQKFRNTSGRGYRNDPYRVHRRESPTLVYGLRKSPTPPYEDTEMIKPQGYSRSGDTEEIHNQSIPKNNYRDGDFQRRTGGSERVYRKFQVDLRWFGGIDNGRPMDVWIIIIVDLGWFRTTNTGSLTFGLGTDPGKLGTHLELTGPTPSS